MSLGATWVTFNWSNAGINQRKGITHYTIKSTWLGNTSQRLPQRVSADQQLNVNATGLHPDYQYKIAVAAVNEVGQGEYSGALVVKTLEDGKHAVSHCSWQSLFTFGILFSPEEVELVKRLENQKLLTHLGNPFSSREKTIVIPF